MAMRRQVPLAGLVVVLLLSVSPVAAYADTAGGTNGPIVYSNSAATAVPGQPAYQVWSINPDGSGRRELLAGRAELNTYPVWSPDGQRLAFYRNTHLVVARVDGSEEHEVLRNVGASVTWSPDGTRLAYTVGDDIGPGAELWVVNADGTDAHEIYRADEINTPAWSPRGDVIVFGADDPAKIGGQSVLWTIATDGTGLRQLTDFDPNGPSS
jgi:Tol biopolymer transport system component